MRIQKYDYPGSFLAVITMDNQMRVALSGTTASLPGTEVQLEISKPLSQMTDEELKQTARAAVESGMGPTARKPLWGK